MECSAGPHLRTERGTYLPYKDALKRSAQGLKTGLKQRRETIELLGGACTQCGLADQRVLEVDHIEQDGASHRRKQGGYGNTRWYILKQLREGVNEGWQLLCANCHAVKTWQHVEDAKLQKYGPALMRWMKP